MDMAYRLVTKDSFRVVGVKDWTSFENGANFVNIPRMWANLSPEKFAELGALANTDLSGVLGACGDMYDGGFDYWIAAATTLPCPAGFEELEVPAATWAVFDVFGPLPGSIQKASQHIYSEWLPACGYEHAKAPDLEWYAEGDTSAADYHCQVWVPVHANG